MNRIDLIIVILVVLFLATQKNKTEVLSKEMTTGLKVICAFIIILCHLYKQVDPGSFIKYFSNWGTLSSAIFFLMSGYGLMISLRKSNGEYLNHFLSRRFSKILIPYFIVNILFSIFYYFNHVEIWQFSFKALLFHGEYLVNFSWFIIAILYFYLLFYISAKISRKEWIMNILLLLGTFVYIHWCCQHDFGRNWYNTCLAFWFGVIMASTFGDKIKAFLSKYVLLSSLSLITIYAFLPQIITKFDFDLMNSKATKMNIMSVLFSLFIVTCAQKFDFSSPYIRRLSKYSFTIYMAQGLPMYYILRSNYMYIDKDYIYVALVLIISCLLGFIIVLIDERLNMLWMKFRLKEK